MTKKAEIPQTRNQGAFEMEHTSDNRTLNMPEPDEYKPNNNVSSLICSKYHMRQSMELPYVKSSAFLAFIPVKLTPNLPNIPF